MSAKKTPPPRLRRLVSVSLSLLLLAGVSSPAWGEDWTTIQNSSFCCNEDGQSPNGNFGCSYGRATFTCSSNCDCRISGVCFFVESWTNVYNKFSRTRHILRNGESVEFYCSFGENGSKGLVNLQCGTSPAPPPPPSPTLSLSSSPLPMGKPILYGKEQESVEARVLMSNSAGKLSNIAYTNNTNVTPILQTGAALSSGSWVTVSKVVPNMD